MIETVQSSTAATIAVAVARVYPGTWHDVTIGATTGIPYKHIKHIKHQTHEITNPLDLPYRNLLLICGVVILDTFNIILRSII